MQPTELNVCVIGLGAMGGRAAAALADRYRVSGSDPSAAARSAAAGAGVTVADDVASAAAPAELILLSLPTPEVVRAVIDQLIDDLPDIGGRIVADLSTIDPGTARESAARLRERGARYVDAPILGRPQVCGNWTLACGGTQSDIAVLAEVAVGTIAKAVERVGDVGAGATLKICNNLMFGAINTVTAEVVDLAERAGVDPARFASIVAGSGAATVSPLFGEIAPRMADRRYDDPTFAVRLLAKDVRLGAELAAELGRPAPIAELVRAITEAAVQQGLGDLDTAAVVESYRRAAVPELSTGSERS